MEAKMKKNVFINEALDLHSNTTQHCGWYFIWLRTVLKQADFDLARRRRAHQRGWHHESRLGVLRRLFGELSADLQYISSTAST